MKVKKEKTESCLVNHKFSVEKTEKLNNLYNFVLKNSFQNETKL